LNTSSSENALEARSVVKVYGVGSSAVTALANVSIDIRHNEFFTLLGPSGCGKTTLLRLFAGFEEITEGEIYLYGEEIEHLAPHQRPVNTVFQHYALFPHMTVAENIAFGLKRLKRPQAEIDATVKEMLALVHMEEFANRKPNQMSGGQMQRVALARALAPKPKVLLLDEPLSALDLKLRQAMREELQRLQKETGITFVFVTHDQDEALSMSERIAVMSAGHVQQIGSPEDIYLRPANKFVADFIGDTNFIDVTVGKAGQFTAKNGLELKLPLKTDLTAGSEAVLNVRPENIVVSSAGKGLFDATVSNRTFLGNMSVFELDLGGGVTIHTGSSNQAGTDAVLSVGSKVSVAFAEGSVSVLTS